MRLLTTILLVLILTTHGATQEDKRVFAFGHSLIDHRPPLIPTPSNETTVLHWMHALAVEAGQTLFGGGQYGFLPQHANLPPLSQWGYDSVPGVWESDYEPFSAADINTVLITAGNFVQWQAPDVDYYTDPGITPLSATEDIIDWVNGEEPGCRYYIYENWPDMAPYLSNGFPATDQELEVYWDELNADFHEWWIDYHDLILDSRPALEVKMIPVGPILSGVFTSVIPNLMSAADIFEDDAPHGRASLYFLAGLTTYMGVYETLAPSSYQVPATIDPAIVDHYQSIVDYIWDQLIAFDTEDGQSRVFFGEVTSLDDLESEAIILFPNPVTDEISLSGMSSRYTIEIYDIVGHLHQTVSDSQSSLKVNVAHLPKGTYMVRVTDESGTTVSSQKIYKRD